MSIYLTETIVEIGRMESFCLHPKSVIRPLCANKLSFCHLFHCFSVTMEPHCALKSAKHLTKNNSCSHHNANDRFGFIKPLLLVMSYTLWEKDDEKLNVLRSASLRIYQSYKTNNSANPKTGRRVHDMNPFLSKIRLT